MPLEKVDFLGEAIRSFAESKDRMEILQASYDRLKEEMALLRITTKVSEPDCRPT